MKILNQIIFIIIVIGIIFVIKDDYKSIYSKSLSYIQNEMNTYAGLGLKDKIWEIINSAKGISSGDSDSGALSSKNAESLPGALVVPDNFLTNRTKEISLSSQNIIDITNKYIYISSYTARALYSRGMEYEKLKLKSKMEVV